MIYPLIRDGRFKSRFLQRQMEKWRREAGAYADAFLELFGGARPYVTQRSCKNRFYSDLVTLLPEKNRRSRYGNPYLLRPENGREIPRPL